MEPRDSGTITFEAAQLCSWTDSYADRLKKEGDEW